VTLLCSEPRLCDSQFYQSKAAMNIANSLPSTVSGISFSFLSTEDIRRISVKQIVNPVLLDNLNRPTIGGLYDPSLGPSDRQDMCAQCRYASCCVSDFSVAVQHADLHISPALAILDTSSCPLQSFIHCSYRTCTHSCEERVYFVTGSR
jgi:DNA-directed RNA polymerase beta' subunit